MGWETPQQPPLLGPESPQLLLHCPLAHLYQLFCCALEGAGGAAAALQRQSHCHPLHPPPPPPPSPPPPPCPPPHTAHTLASSHPTGTLPGMCHWHPAPSLLSLPWMQPSCPPQSQQRHCPPPPHPQPMAHSSPALQRMGVGSPQHPAMGHSGIRAWRGVGLLLLLLLLPHYLASPRWGRRRSLDFPSTLAPALQRLRWQRPALLPGKRTFPGRPCPPLGRRCPCPGEGRQHCRRQQRQQQQPRKGEAGAAAAAAAAAAGALQRELRCCPGPC